MSDNEKFNAKRAFDVLYNYILTYDRILYSTVSNIIYECNEEGKNEKILKTKTTMRNRIRNGCKNILKQGFPEAVYSAFMATLIFNDENFKTCMEILKRQDIWDDELEESFQKMNNNVFKIRRE